MPSAMSSITFFPSLSHRIVSGWCRSAVYKSPPCAESKADEAVRM